MKFTHWSLMESLTPEPQLKKATLMVQWYHIIQEINVQWKLKKIICHIIDRYILNQV